MNKIGALLITFAAGMSFLLGALLPPLFKNKKKIAEISIAIAFVVMLGVIVLDLIPEAYNTFSNFRKIYRYLFMFGFGILGIVILKVLDIFVPDHNHDEVPKNKHEKHLYHIGFVTSIALIFHNIVEGLSIFSSYLLNSKTGILLSIGVMLHNIPFGIQISSNLENDKVKRFLVLSILSCSTILGALTIFIFNITISHFWLGIFTSITLGMMIYIVLFELLNEVVLNIKNKITIVGLICGLVCLFFAYVVGEVL